MTTVKEKTKGLIAIRYLMGLFDDGYHLKEIQVLTALSNELFLSLSEENQVKFREYLQRKEKEKEEES